MSASTFARRARVTHGDEAADRGWAPSPAAVMATVVMAVLAGLTIALLIAPIAGRGDYGQWLMTARYYMGESVPGYRVIPALPPLVPMTMAAIHTILPDPIATLQATNALILVALGVSFYLLGRWLFASPATGAFAVVAGLLVTDRYIELFAFGGLLQAAAVDLDVYECRRLRILHTATAASEFDGGSSDASSSVWRSCRTSARR